MANPAHDGAELQQVILVRGREEPTKRRLVQGNSSAAATGLHVLEERLSLLALIALKRPQQRIHLLLRVLDLRVNEATALLGGGLLVQVGGNVSG
eukprot:scaffold368_cov258-Pinguiococcus_pyrenoidosus.AAC.39